MSEVAGEVMKKGYKGAVHASLVSGKSKFSQSSLPSLQSALLHSRTILLVYHSLLESSSPPL